MIWDGDWLTGKSYTPKTVVSFPLFGTVVSSYFCKVAHTADSLNAPPNDTYWDTVELGSAGTVVGLQGPAGPAGTGSTVVTSAVVNGTIPTRVSRCGDALTNYDSGSLLSSSKFYCGLLETDS